MVLPSTDGGENQVELRVGFSRPASGIYVQYYKFLRYGLAGL